MAQDRRDDEDRRGPGLVYAVGIFLFVFSAVNFYVNLQWLLLATQKAAPHHLSTPEIARHLENLKSLEQQIPFFYLRQLYGLVLNGALIIAVCGLLRFRKLSRKAVQFLLGLDAILFFLLTIYYLVTGYEPRMVEKFHACFVFTVGQILLLMFLGSSTFMKVFVMGQGRHESQSVSDTR